MLMIQVPLKVLTHRFQAMNQFLVKDLTLATVFLNHPTAAQIQIAFVKTI